MKLKRSAVSWGLTVGVLLAWSAPASAADVASCRAALFRAHRAYMIGATKAKAKEAQGRLTGRLVTAGLTAQKIARARASADGLISAGCADVAMQQAADPNVCPGAPDLQACLDDFVAKADMHTDNVLGKVLRECDSNPACGKDGMMPLCTSEDDCHCHKTIEGEVFCISPFECTAARPCIDSSSECDPGQACYVNTCCGPFPVCGSTVCTP